MLNKIFSRKDTDVYLLNQSDFKSNYRLVTESIYTMGKENPPVLLKNTADIEMEQLVLIPKNKILTAITTKNIVNETNNPAFEKGLDEAELFTEIIPRIVIERNLRGDYTKIANMERINANWQSWKEERLPSIFPELPKQKKIINNFENGLKVLDENFNNNFQYTLLLPECYKYRDFFNPSDIGTVKKYDSRFIQNLQIGYQLKKENFKVENHNVE